MLRPSASAFTVTTVDDSGPGSLREAIERANGAGTQSRISFAVEAGPVIIRPNGPLPTLGFSGEIDARSQPGYVGSPMIELRGDIAAENAASDALPICGLDVAASGLLIEGFAVTRWTGDAAFVRDGGENILRGCYFGVGLNGVTSAGNGGAGVHITRSVKNRIGGTSPEDAVVASGNAGRGIWAEYGADETQVWGSFVGTDRSGRFAIPNGATGLAVLQSAKVQIGGRGAAYRNVLSGNRLYGLAIGGPDSQGAIVIGNYIGVDASGLSAIPNRTGVLLKDCFGCQIGAETGQDRNVISGSTRAGITIDGAVLPDNLEEKYGGCGYAKHNVIRDNYLGVDATGERVIGNGLRAILINYAQDNDVFDNVIGGSGQDGVLILGPADQSDPNLVPARNRIRRNLIGVSRCGALLPIGRHGVYVQHGRDNVVGGPNTDDANTIRHCTKRGVMFRGVGWETNALMPGNDISDNGQGALYAAP